jgi:hypothetical protein
MGTVRGLYRELLQIVRRFPPEKILELSPNISTFSKAASVQIRQEFKANMNLDATTAGKKFLSGQKELKALKSILANEHLSRHPGPKAVDKLQK